MSDQKRRDFVKLTGGVIGFGTALSSRGPVAATATQELPPLRGPYADEDWVGYRNGSGHNGVVSEAPTIDADAPECEKIYDGPVDGDLAIADGTIYAADGNGHIVALDAQDGSEQWTSDDVSAGKSPSAAYNRIITTGDGSVLALNVADGSLDWETALDGEVKHPAVGYETVFVVAGESFYTLDVTDGSIKWERTDEKFGLTPPHGIGSPAIGHGHVYTNVYQDDSANDQALVALDVTTGEEIWRTAPDKYVSGEPIASEGKVSAAASMDERIFYDAETGDFTNYGGGERTPAHTDDIKSFSSESTYLKTVFIDSGESWEFWSEGPPVSHPVIAGDTVYAYFGPADGGSGEEYENSLIAFNLSDGSIKWQCEAREPQRVIATSDAVYIAGTDRTIYAAFGKSTDGDDSTDEETETPEDTPSPDDSEKDCGCPNDTDSSSGGDDTSTDTATATDEDTVSGESSKSTDEDYQAVENGTSTEETDGAGPGLGIVSAVTGLGGIGYVLRRRLVGGEPDSDSRDL